MNPTSSKKHLFLPSSSSSSGGAEPEAKLKIICHRNNKGINHLQRGHFDEAISCFVSSLRMCRSSITDIIPKEEETYEREDQDEDMCSSSCNRAELDDQRFHTTHGVFSTQRVEEVLVVEERTSMESMNEQQNPGAKNLGEAEQSSFEYRRAMALHLPERESDLDQESYSAMHSVVSWVCIYNLALYSHMKANEESRRQHTTKAIWEQAIRLYELALASLSSPDYENDFAFLRVAILNNLLQIHIRVRDQEEATKVREQLSSALMYYLTCGVLEGNEWLCENVFRNLSIHLLGKIAHAPAA